MFGPKGKPVHLQFCDPKLKAGLDELRVDRPREPHEQSSKLRRGRFSSNHASSVERQFRPRVTYGKSLFVWMIEECFLKLGRSKKACKKWPCNVGTSCLASLEDG